MPLPTNDPGLRPGSPVPEARSPFAEGVPPPFYSDRYGEMDIHHKGFGTNARVADDGRVDVNIQEKGRKLSNIVAPALLPSEEGLHERPSIPESLTGAGEGRIPKLNIVIQIVGSRGDVQPFIALGLLLKNEYGHRIRIATHPVFKDFVEKHDLEFFSIGADPAELMAYMVRNPGLMPGFDSLRNGDVGKRRKEIAEIISGCWRSCFEAGDGMTGFKTESQACDIDSIAGRTNGLQPFLADVIIANPPSFAHIHCAEKLGIPLHLMFTMPWSPTQAFSHPLVNIQHANTDIGVANFVSYVLFEMMTWQGLGDIINRFREHTLGLEPISLMWAPGMIPRLRIPYTYCWSPALIPKPRDWGSNIDISGFFFLQSSSDYTPPDDLADFLAAGPPPVYIGFGSIVVDDPDGMTKLIFEAVKKVGQRALVSKGWGGIGAEQIGVPEGVFMIGNCPHDWLFPRVSCVVHHGGAGTTAAGIACGKPTVVVPFFGDQPFWGSIVSKAGAGPPPVPSNQLTADSLADAISVALEPERQDHAKALGAKVRADNGLQNGAQSFHDQLHLDSIRCKLAPERPAVWRIKRTKIRLSSFAVMALTNEGILNLDHLKLYRPREYDLEPGPRDPVTGGAAALIESVVDFTLGFADIPAELIRPIAFPSSQKNQVPSLCPRSSGHLSQSPMKSSSSHDRKAETTSVPPASSEEAVPDVSLGVDVERDEQPASDDDASTVASTVASTDSKKSHKEKTARVSKFTTSEITGAARAASKIITVSLKSPMNFALSVAKGFHNAPKLYGDESVRSPEKVTGFRSGLKAAGKEFGYSFYDGVTGLVTQPLHGRKEGPTGVLKGIGKGIGGFILKPGAGIFGLAGYPLNGIYKEVRKLFGSSVESYIIAHRTKRGYEEWENSTQAERDEVLRRWYLLGVDLETKAASSRFASEWEAISAVLFDPKRRGITKPSAVEKLAPDNFSESVRAATHLLSRLINRYKNEPILTGEGESDTDREFSRAEATDDARQNEVIERALRASISESDKARACGDQQHAGDRALHACIDVVNRAQGEGKTGRISDKPIMGKRRESADSVNPTAREKRHETKEEKQKLSKQGLDAVAEYAIWKTLTEQRETPKEQTVSGPKLQSSDDVHTTS